MRVRAALSATALALSLAGAGIVTAGAASADPYTSTPTVPTVDSVPVPPEVAGEVVTPAGTNTPAGSLPVTGGDVAGMLLVAAVAVGGGTVLVATTRRRGAGAGTDDTQA